MASLVPLGNRGRDDGRQHYNSPGMLGFAGGARGGAPASTIFSKSE
jgi:hypothetical protein